MLKFSELSPLAQNRAAQDYVKGWQKTHPRETFTPEEAISFCVDSEDDVLYMPDGTLVELDEEEE